MARLNKTKPTSNFSDETSRWTQFIKERLNKFLMDTGVAYKDTYDNPEVYPFIKSLGGETGDYGGVTQSWSDAEFTPEENQQMKNGLTPKDILILRGYKRIPRMVGK